jgi:uncharacterized protein (AIM24 family)
MTHFTNRGHTRSKVAFTAPYPGTVIPVNLSEAYGNQLIVQRDAFLCAALGTNISMHLNRNIGSGLFGGEGFILQKLQGDGLAFIHAGGTVVEKQLNNDVLRVDTGCVVAFESSVSFDVQRSGGLRSMVFGGEGLFLATLQGTGKVLIQSMPISKLVQALAPYGKNSKKEGGSLLGSLMEE